VQIKARKLWVTKMSEISVFKFNFWRKKIKSQAALESVMETTK